MNNIVRQQFFMTAKRKKRLKSHAALNVKHFPMFPKLERAY